MNKKPFFTEDELVMLRNEIGEGYVSEKKHPEFDLWIYNYTPKTQYDWHWNEITIKCRGLILDNDGCLVAKGFDKFFTLEQLEAANETDKIPSNEPFEIFDKVDGSLGIMYFWDDMHYIATRGSFESEMAHEANSWLREQYGHIVFYPEYTYMFEIIYPENRIVVDYGDERKLVLLGVYNNETGEEYSIYDEQFDYIEEQGLERAKMFKVDNWKDALSVFDGMDNVEGVVVRFTESNYRVKMKIEWYNHLSRMMQNFTKRGIWKMIRDFDDTGVGAIENVINDVPDELYPIVHEYVNELYKEHDIIWSRALNLERYVESYCIERYGEENYGDKEYYHALSLHSSKDDRSIVMAIHKGKDPFSMIWKRIKPSL